MVNNMDEHYYAVIMAGGGGTRLWPLSRKAKPKQMVALFDERSLFQTSVHRLKGLFPPERIYVVTVQDQATELQAQCPEIPAQNFLIEPMPRGTASVVGMAAVYLQRIDPQATMAILTSDHFIGNEPRFRQLLQTAQQVAAEGYLVTLGIQPTFPATGFGYIQSGEALRQFQGEAVFQVQRFVEKPDENRARAMLASGDFSWNSGMFVWRVSQIMDEFNRQMPDLAARLAQMAASTQAGWQDTVSRIWPGIQEQTIDYGIMEGAHRVAVLPAAGLDWNDVGSWDSLFEVIEGDDNGNIVIGGQHLGLDTHDSLFYMNQDRRFIVTIGVQDLVVVDTGDVILVCHKDQAQRVRQVVNQLKSDGVEYL